MAHLLVVCIKHETISVARKAWVYGTENNVVSDESHTSNGTRALQKKEAEVYVIQQRGVARTMSCFKQETITVQRKQMLMLQNGTAVLYFKQNTVRLMQSLYYVTERCSNNSDKHNVSNRRELL